MLKIINNRYVGGTPFINLIEVSGFKGAIHGMRNPMNSWRLNDSLENDFGFVLGENDMKLAKNLIKGGSEHRKFLRMIHVQFDLNLPRYVWSEFDTYKIGTVANSCSTMHKLLNKDDEKEWEETELDKLLATRGDISKENFWYAQEDEEMITTIIKNLNQIKNEFLNTKDIEKKRHLKRRAKQILPECYLQMRTIDTNYEQLMNLVRQRRQHQLNLEWGMICNFVESLPHMVVFMGLNDMTLNELRIRRGLKPIEELKEE